QTNPVDAGALAFERTHEAVDAPGIFGDPLVTAHRDPLAVGASDRNAIVLPDHHDRDVKRLCADRLFERCHLSFKTGTGNAPNRAHLALDVQPDVGVEGLYKAAEQ